MQLVYIYHSGFALLADGITVIIDYYRDTLQGERNKGVVHNELLKRPGTLYVLSSHFHPDHFNKTILTWKKKHTDVINVFSKDILEQKKATETDAIYLDKGEIYQDNNICIQAFGSTDVGVSFLINIEGKTIFHAGDLNNWHWSEEYSPEEIQQAENWFLAEVKLIQKKMPQIDLVMFPVDYRLGKDYMKGASQFVEQIKTSIFAPMHFGKRYQEANAFRETAEANGCRFLSITQRGDTFEIY